MKCYMKYIVLYEMFLIWERYGPTHLILRNAEVIWCPFQRRSSTAGHICPCVNSLPLLALCPCGLRHGRCVYSLDDQHVSLWPWPSHSSSASCLEQAVLRTIALQRPSGGGKHVAISSACMVSTWHELFVADESPPHQLHRPLSFKEPVIKLATPSSLSNQTLQPDLIVFQRIIGVLVARLKLGCNKLQSFEIEHLLFGVWQMFL